MLVVAALGGNALLRRGQRPTAEIQRANVETASRALAEILEAGHRLVITHGNGPQVGLLALQDAACAAGPGYPLDVLGAETEGMIGYLIEQELGNLLPAGPRIATLLTQIEVDPRDPAFAHPTKPIGPLYDRTEADRIASTRGWAMAADGSRFRRVVPSPVPLRILEHPVIELLVGHEVVVICAGGGGIPVVRRPDGCLVGVEAVIDKDSASALLARTLAADALLLLTDVDAVYADWDAARRRPLGRTTPDALRRLELPAGSMGPKAAAACAFVSARGGLAGIGRLEDAAAILQGRAGTIVEPELEAGRGS